MDTFKHTKIAGKCSLQDVLKVSSLTGKNDEKISQLIFLVKFQSQDDICVYG